MSNYGYICKAGCEGMCVPQLQHLYCHHYGLSTCTWRGGAIQSVSVPKVPKPDQTAFSACAKNNEGPKPGEHVQLFRMERDRNKGFYTEKCSLQASIALYFEWAWCLVPRVTHLAQCARSATIWVCGRTRDPYFVILGGHHCCLRVGFDASTLVIWHFWIFT